LRSCVQGGSGGGYARLEQGRGKYILTVNAHGFSPQEEGIRVLLASGESRGGAAVCDLGLLPISQKGHAALKRELAATPGGMPLEDYAALCIVKDWPTPRLLLLGTLEENSSLSAYLMGETVRQYLSVPSKASPPPEPSPEVYDVKAASAPPSPVPPIPALLPDISLSMPQVRAPAEALPFPLAPAASKKAGSPVTPAKETAPPPAPESESIPDDLGPSVYTAAREAPPAGPVFPDAGPPTGMQPVMALTRLHWPSAVKELETYFSVYPPFAPFDAPGWRFVQVPMAAGSTIPYYAVGMLARDGKVTQVAYAVPGDRGALPPAGFSGYRWQQGRNGQGYWTLWKRA
jgi:hypothetical protein